MTTRFELYEDGRESVQLPLVLSCVGEKEEAKPTGDEVSHCNAKMWMADCVSWRVNTIFNYSLWELLSFILWGRRTYFNSLGEGEIV
jgi:hypothetical protein